MNRRRAAPDVMPLSEFSQEARERFDFLASLDKPPPKWLTIGDGEGRPLAQIQSRAWYEWHIRRGRDPRRAKNKIPPPLRTAVILRDGHVCGICGGQVDPGDVHIDHVVPEARGGQTVFTNLQVAHSLCNLRKGTRA